MIGTNKKAFEEILEMLDGSTNVAVVGCGDCATSCQTGGEKEVAEMSDLLAKKGKKITHAGVVEVGCDKRLVKKYFRDHHKDMHNTEAVLVLACGSGVQTAAEVFEKKVLPGLDSLFIGQIDNLSRFYERCSVCGECVLADTGGICPITRCSKGLVNGPCGGSDKGKCEADRENDCAWYLIFERMKKTDQFSKLTSLKKIKSYKASHGPRKIEIKRARG
ncbi:MAG: methylenetetrahydrofolate reductase C-terminal domain-containing protein [bacterium]